jgi:hypothetical protein
VPVTGLAALAEQLPALTRVCFLAVRHLDVEGHAALQLALEAGHERR